MCIITYYEETNSKHSGRSSYQFENRLYARRQGHDYGSSQTSGGVRRENRKAKADCAFEKEITRTERACRLFPQPTSPNHASLKGAKHGCKDSTKISAQHSTGTKLQSGRAQGNRRRLGTCHRPKQGVNADNRGQASGPWGA